MLIEVEPPVLWLSRCELSDRQLRRPKTTFRQTSEGDMMT